MLFPLRATEAQLEDQDQIWAQSAQRQHGDRSPFKPLPITISFKRHFITIIERYLSVLVDLKMRDTVPKADLRAGMGRCDARVGESRTTLLSLQLYYLAHRERLVHKHR